MVPPGSQGRLAPTRVCHVSEDPTVYIGCSANGASLADELPVGVPGWLGNPYDYSEHGHADAVELYRDLFEDRLASDPQFRTAVADCQGRRLGCWCRFQDEQEPVCHGDVIAEWADQLAEWNELETSVVEFNVATNYDGDLG
jgi:hypothetical protein